jgi:hypothetical protein
LFANNSCEDLLGNDCGSTSSSDFSSASDYSSYCREYGCTTEKYITSSEECTAAGGDNYNYCPETKQHYCCDVQSLSGYFECGGTVGQCSSNGSLQNCVCPSQVIKSGEQYPVYCNTSGGNVQCKNGKVTGSDSNLTSCNPACTTAIMNSGQNYQVNCNEWGGNVTCKNGKVTGSDSNLTTCNPDCSDPSNTIYLVGSEGWQDSPQEEPIYMNE